MRSGQLTRSTEGTPQGGIISPLLANLYLHEVLDKWFVEQVQPLMKSASFIVRYADDFILGFHEEQDARRVMKVLSQRFNKYGLNIHPQKTRLVRFKHPVYGPEGPSESFDFLGFTHRWELNHNGKGVVRRKTAKARFARSLKELNQWCRLNRHRKMSEQIKAMKEKLRGHYAYYGIRGNYKSLANFRFRALFVWYRWLCRRTRNCAGIKVRFSGFCNKATYLYKVDCPRIVHSDV